MAKISPTQTGAFQKALSQTAADEPIRGELYSVERLEQFAAVLAEEHRKIHHPKRFQKLLPRLKDNGRILVRAYHSLVGQIGDDSAISPAAEWLIDNFHVVEEQLREIREDLPPSFYRELPKLADGEFAGYPRIYAIALMIIAHTDSRLETETLEKFLRAYQKVTPLTIGELWAMAITLRIALVENLRRLSVNIIVSREEREEADALADELLDTANKNPDQLLPLMIKRLGKRKHFGNAFTEQLTRQMRDQDSAIALAYDWLQNQLRKDGTSVEEIVQAEYQGQAAAQVTVGNIITSMRLLSTIDWSEFFESVSLIDPLLQTDPADVYSKMVFATRNRYRSVIERLARRTKTDELEVAKRVIEFAGQARRKNPNDQRRSHIGYYLIDEGLREIERDLRYKPPAADYFQRFVLKFPTAFYLGTTLVLTTILVAVSVFIAAYDGVSLPILIIFGLLSIVPASELALSFVNWDVTLSIPPRLLPQMDTSASIPESAATMVVIPTLLTSETSVEELLEKLEVYCFANQDEHLYFALLSDFADADAEEMPADAAILELANRRIAELNKGHYRSENAKFHLFHRRRLWNESEGKWMGWERKRGKLEEFNRLLRGAEDTSFHDIHGGQGISRQN